VKIGKLSTGILKDVIYIYMLSSTDRCFYLQVDDKP